MVKTKKKTAVKIKVLQGKPKNFDELIKATKINTSNIKIIHDDIEKRLKEILSTQSKIMDYIAFTRSYKKKLDRLEDVVEKLEKKFDHTDKISESSVKGIQKDISKEFDHINSIFVDEVNKIKKKTDGIGLDIGIMRERIGDLKIVEENMKELDIKTLRRDIEILKTKNEWVEDRIGEINTITLEEKISLLERRIKSMKFASPLILE
ncbi:MAG: hypothetical protein ABIF08_00405 [Nanoarchaeota archaeon]